MKKALFVLCAFLFTFSLLPAGPALMEPPPEPITADGDLSDWAGIWSLAPGEGKIGILYAFVTDTYFAAAFQAPDTTDIGIYDILLDTDNNPETGYRAPGNYKNAGGDFLVETWTAGLYTDDPTGQEWAWKGEDYPEIRKAASKDNTAVEVLIPLSVLGNPERINMAVWVNDADWNMIGFAPETGGDFIRVPHYDEVKGAPITDPIRDIALALEGDLRALGPSALPGGLVGTLSAAGGDGQTYEYAFKPDAANGRDNALFALDGTRLMTGEIPLAPGTYKVCVQVSSLIRKESANLIVEILPQDPLTPITPAIFDGELGQWYTVPHDAAKLPPNLTALKAQTDGNRLWFFAAAEQLGDAFEIYLQNDAAKGADLGENWQNAAPAHKITADSRLWAYENGAWQDTGKKAALFKTAKGVEGFVMAARLNPLTKTFALGITDGEGGQLPLKGLPLLEVTSPNRLFSPAIKADGDAGDWADVPLLAKGTGVVGDTYAARTQEMLYVLTHLSGVTDPTDDRAFSINILVDADGDPSNGFAHPGYPAHSGIDVLVQDWHSTNLELFIFQKPSTEWFSCVYRAPEGIKKAVMDLGDGHYAMEYQIPIALLKANLPELSDDFYLAVDREVDMQEGTSVGVAPEAHLQSSALLKVPKYRTTADHLSVKDNSFLDWDAVGGKAVPSAEALRENLLGTLSRDKLYVLASGLNMNARYTLDITGGDGKTWQVADSRLMNPEGGFVRDVLSRIHGGHISLQLYLADIGSPEKVDLVFRQGQTEQKLTVQSRFEMVKDSGLYYPREDFTLQDKPYHGWAAWASVNPEDRIAQPFQTAFLDVKWDEFEPEKGQYNFDLLEERYRLSYWKEQGVRFLLRFVMDDVVPTGGQQRMDIPRWLYEELAAENFEGKGADGAGTFYDEPELLGGGGFSPNYKSPILIERHRLAIKALAERFDDNAVTAFVQVGSLGHWAEMHTWPDGTGEFPDPDLVGVYMQAYTEAFHKVKLAARKPYPYASGHNWGLYNDMFGDVGASDTFRDYFINGCTDMPHASAAQVQESRMPLFWQTGYSGGEFAEGNVRKWITDSAIAETLRLIRESHSSLIGPCSPTDLLESQEDAHKYDANIDAIRRQMGYQLTLESVTQVAEARAGDSLALQMTWLNRGVAPFYYPWPLELSLGMPGEEPVLRAAGLTDVRALLPGRVTTAETLALPEDLPGGTYTLYIGFLDMDSNRPALPLNMEGGVGLRYPLYQIKVQ